MLKFLFRVSVSILAATFLLSVLPVSGEGEIYESVVRLHVLANSDSDADQALKLRVRDVMQKRAAELFRDCKTAEDAEAAAKQHQTELEQLARQVIADSGCDDPVTVTLTREIYPTRYYGDFTFPAGEYTSLRVLIGAAAGHNWWCVLFPPLCLGAASEIYAGGGVSYDRDTDSIMYEAGFSPRQVEMLTDSRNKKTVIKFKIVEIFEALFSS